MAGFAAGVARTETARVFRNGRGRWHGKRSLADALDNHAGNPVAGFLCKLCINCITRICCKVLKCKELSAKIASALFSWKCMNRQCDAERPELEIARNATVSVPYRVGG
jgi:hypothetical protein